MDTWIVFGSEVQFSHGQCVIAGFFPEFPEWWLGKAGVGMPDSLVLKNLEHVVCWFDEQKSDMWAFP